MEKFFINNWSDIATIVIAALALVIAIRANYFSNESNRISKSALKESKKSNSIASNALIVSEESNLIANKAYSISEKEHQRNVLNDLKKDRLDVQIKIDFLPNNIWEPEPYRLDTIHFNVFLENRSKEKFFEPKSIILFKCERANNDESNFYAVSKIYYNDSPHLFKEIPPKSAEIGYKIYFRQHSIYNVEFKENTEIYVVIKDKYKNEVKSNIIKF